MKRTLHLPFLLLIFLFSCGHDQLADHSIDDKLVEPKKLIEEPEPQKDVARDISTSVKTSKWVTDFIEKLRNTDASSQADTIEKYKGIRRHVVLYARQTNAITTRVVIDSVVYYYGSSDSASVADKEGKIWQGKITNELVAFIYLEKVKTPIGIIVYSGNTTFAPLRNDLRRIGKFSTKLKIANHHGFNTYVDYPTSIWLADYFKLLIYIGKRSDHNFITADSARKLAPYLDKIKVSVDVFDGDDFNINKMEFTRGDAHQF